MIGNEERIEEEEKKNKRIGLFASIGVHAVLLLLFLILVAWQPPDPPHPEYGIEINLGIDDQGSGDEPVTTPADPTEQDQPAETQPEEQTEPEPVEPNPVPEPATPVETDNAAETQPEPSPVVAEPKPEKPKEQPKEEPKEKAKEPAKEKPKEEVKAAYPGAKSDSDAKTKPGGSSQGDDKDKKGDQGDPSGTLDTKNQYGKGGGGGGSLEMTGWTWDSPPKVNDQSQAEGRIVFEVTIDDNGEIIGVKTLEKSVPPAVEQLYRREVEKLTFTRTTSQKPAKQSKGKITFIIRSN